MNRQFSTALAGMGLVAFFACPAIAGGVDFYVSPTAGNDTNAGTLVAPFATLEQARTAIRALKSGPGLPAGGANIWLRGGIYLRTNTFELTTNDAGTLASPVAWRGYPGEESRVIGAANLDPSWFTLVSNTSPVWSRLDTNAQGRVMEINLAAHGITNYGTLRIRGFGTSTIGALELFFTNAPMPLARWPDPSQDEPDQTFTNSQLTLWGNPGPQDVTGLYNANGLSDGINRFSRVGLVNGKQYNLYRYTPGNASYTAWFLTTSTNGYPANTDPWWFRYTLDLGDMSAATSQSGATGTPTFHQPGQITHGWAWITAAVSTNGFTYGGTRPERWSQAEEPWFHGYWYYLWADQYQKAANIDTNSKTVLLGGVPPGGIRGSQPYYALNLLEEITQPGEWYLNRTNGQLYFWPPAALTGADIYVSMIEQPLWRLKNTTNVVVRDLTIEMGRTDLIAIEGGARNAFIHCTLRNAGNYAGRVGGVSNGVSSCTILHPGDGGIALSGNSSRASLVPVCNFVRNCQIRDFSRWTWTYEPAVLINAESVGCWVSHNVMRDSPHTAMIFNRSNDNLIEFNEISDVCLWTSDAGAVYAYYDWAARGNILRWNFIHDVGSLFGKSGTQGIYLDGCQSGVCIFGNVLYKVADLAIQINGGRDNLMENNLIARCGSGIGAMSCGTSYMLASGASSNLWADLQRYPYQSTLWSSAYPACAAIPNTWQAVTNGLWLHPHGNVFSRNMGFANENWTYTDDNAFVWFAEMSNNIPDTDPLFVDEANLNLELRTDSPAYTIPGFQPIPFAQIGLESPKALAIQVQGQGAVTATPAETNYYPMQFVCLSATPSNLWYFDSWTGDVSGTSNPVCVWTTNDLAATAVFKPYVVTNGTPLWWLAQYGLPTNNAGALADSDNDGCPNWQEYIAGTNPTNAASRFAIQSVSADTNGSWLTFPAASNRTYDVEFRSDLLDTNGWRLLTNVAPSADALLQINDSSNPGSRRFYRIKALVP